MDFLYVRFTSHSFTEKKGLPILLILFMNLQRQAIRIKEESHLTPVKVVIA